MEAIIRFLQDTGFYLFTQDGNWRCLVMIGIACVLLYLGIVKKFEPLLLVPIAFGMLITLSAESPLRQSFYRSFTIRAWRKMCSRHICSSS